MSEENVEIARRAYEEFNRGDQQAMVADVAPNSNTPRPARFRA
jgi:hypothetical protein